MLKAVVRIRCWTLYGRLMVSLHIVNWAMILIAAGQLGGCGFEPMLAVRSDTSSVADDLGKIRIPYIENRSGQILRNHLINTLTPRGEPRNPEYVLLIRIEEPQQHIAYRRDDSISRYGYSVVAYWSLNDNKTGTRIINSGSSSSTTFAVSDSEYATLASLQGARDRVMQDISQNIRDTLATFFISRKPVTASRPQ